MLIVYSKSCLACTNKALWKQIKSYAARKNVAVEQRRVNIRSKWKDEADSYGVGLPFSVLNGKVVSHSELTEEL